jgi:hypothetical protein
MSDFDGLISTAFKQLFVDAINEVLSNTGLTIPCQLIYSGSKFILCNNCLFNPTTGKSSGRYKTGGPISFSAGICPKCKGGGKLLDEQTQTLYFGVIWDSKQWIGKLPVGNPNEYVQTISKAEYFDEIKRANSIIIDTDLSDYTKNKFERASEPYFVEFGSSDFIFTMWKRIS